MVGLRVTAAPQTAYLVKHIVLCVTAAAHARLLERVKQDPGLYGALNACMSYAWCVHTLHPRKLRGRGVSRCLPGRWWGSV
jgi:hypothetical protein